MDEAHAQKQWNDKGGRLHEHPVPGLLEVLIDAGLYVSERLFILEFHHTADELVGLVKLELEFFSVSFESHCQKHHYQSNASRFPDDLVKAEEAGKKAASHFMDKHKTDK